VDDPIGNLLILAGATVCAALVWLLEWLGRVAAGRWW
jgi:hypothetical protein